MDSLEQDLDTVSGRLAEIEKSVAIIEENMLILSHQLKETQHFLIKLAKNQSEVTKRINHWPFIAVPEGGDDEAL